MEPESNLAAMLSDLANLYESADAIARIKQRWPDFLPEAPRDATFTIKRRGPSGEDIPLKVPEELHYVLWIQDLVRSLWTGNFGPYDLSALQHILLSGPLGWTSRVSALSVNPQPMTGVIGIDWKRGTFIYTPKTLLQKTLYYLLQNSNKAKLCANPDCPAPYFIGSRSNSRYCSEDCVAQAQREAKAEWWDKHGDEWRKGNRISHPKLRSRRK